MATYKVCQMIDNQPTFDKPLESILSDLEVGGAIKTLTPLEFHTDRQRAWWKGVLLKSLAKDSGETDRQWETRLIMSIFPDDVRYIGINSQVFPVVPSITNYGKRKMSKLIEESVAYLRDECDIRWVTLPDSELRKE